MAIAPKASLKIQISAKQIAEERDRIIQRVR